MLKLEYTNKFKKDVKLLQKRGYKMEEMKEIINKLVNEEIPLPAKNCDHKLSGNLSKYRECHIAPDWLLLYYYLEGVVVFASTGTHSDLFR